MIEPRRPPTELARLARRQDRRRPVGDEVLRAPRTDAARFDGSIEWTTSRSQSARRASSICRSWDRARGAIHDATFLEADRREIARRRGPHNRLGFA